MRNLVPQLNAVEQDYDGTKRLPARLERVAQLLADGELTQQQVARRCKTSVPSIWRLKQQPAFMARLTHLAQLAAERAERAAPLGYKGNRVALIDAEVRALRDQLHANNYTTTLGVSKQGNPIVGFDSARVSAMLRGVALIDAILSPKHSTIVEQTNNTLNVNAPTLDEAVTKIQALLSRADPGTPPAGPQGWRGVSSETESVREDGAVLDTEYTTILDAKAVEVKRDAE